MDVSGSGESSDIGPHHTQRAPQRNISVKVPDTFNQEPINCIQDKIQGVRPLVSRNQVDFFRNLC